MGQGPSKDKKLKKMDRQKKGSVTNSISKKKHFIGIKHKYRQKVSKKLQVLINIIINIIINNN